MIAKKKGPERSRPFSKSPSGSVANSLRPDDPATARCHNSLPHCATIPSIGAVIAVSAIRTIPAIAVAPPISWAHPRTNRTNLHANSARAGAHAELRTGGRRKGDCVHCDGGEQKLSHDILRVQTDKRLTLIIFDGSPIIQVVRPTRPSSMEHDNGREADTPAPDHSSRSFERAQFCALAQLILIPLPYQSDLTIYGKDVMDFTVLGLRSM